MEYDPEAVFAQIRRLLDKEASGPRHNVNEVVKRYLASVEFGNLKAHTTEEIRFRRHLLPILGGFIAADVDFNLVAWYREQRKSELCLNGHNAPPSPATRNREVMQLSACLTWAVKYKLMTVNPIRGAPMEAERSQRRTMPKPAEIEQLLFACTPRLRAMIAMSFDSGMRRAELCSLPLIQVEWDEGLIVLHGRDTKTGRPRVTVMTDRASRYVQIYLKQRTETSRFMFCTSSGRQVSPRNFLRDFQEACGRAGIEAAAGECMWLHDLRAGFIGHQLELGTPERVIMDMTGHSTHKAFDRYVRVTRRWITEAKARADEFEAGRKGPKAAPTSEEDSTNERSLGVVVQIQASEKN